MLFDGPLVRRVADIDIGLISATLEQVETRYYNQWLSRTKLDIGTKVLKIIAPLPNVDLLSPDEQEALRVIMKPLLDTIPIGDNETICYADISNLHAGASLKLHFDNVWLHVLSRRIHIPLKTNILAKMGFLIARNEVQVEHFALGGIYEVNNTHPHSARNGGTDERLHLIVDIIDKDSMKFIEKTWMNPVVAPSINWVWGDISYHHMTKALE